MKMMWRIIIVVAASLILPSPATAQENASDDTRPSGATFLGDTGLWFVPTAEILPHGQFSLSAQRANFDRQEGITDIEHNPATFAVGIANRVELFGSFRVLTRVDRDARPLFNSSNPSVGGPAYQVPLVNDQYTGNKSGDLVLGGKVNLISESNQSPLAVALRGLVKIPTGDKQTGNTSGKSDVAFDLVLSKSLDAAEIAAYGGYGVRGDPSGMDLPDSIRWGLGTGVPVANTVRLFGEISGEFLTQDTLTLELPLVGPDGSQSPLTSSLKNPIDLTLGLQWEASSGLYVGAGLNFSLVHDDREIAGRRGKTGDRLGLLVRIGYHRGVKVYVPPPPPTPAPENRGPQVTLNCNPCELMVGEESQLRADASDPDGDALEYRWSAPAGEFQGGVNRSTQQWQAPSDATRVPVTVTVEDGYGGTASDTVTLDVTEPPPPPAREYVFEDVHFDFDRYTLRVEASRVLDEVVSAMQDDPNLRIQIDGHTCNIGTAEYNLALSERRSNSVEEYLTSRGISSSRLQTQSYGEERPQHDNTREETRRLNRRAALTVTLQ